MFYLSILRTKEADLLTVPSMASLWDMLMLSITNAVSVLEWLISDLRMGRCQNAKNMVSPLDMLTSMR